MENGGNGDPATRAAGGMCDRFLTFLTKNLTMSRAKSIADGPRNNGAGGEHPPATEGREEEDEFAIPIERAEFNDYEFGGHGGDGGYSSVPTTILEDSAAATTTRDNVNVPEKKAGAATAAAEDGAVAAEPAPAPVEERKVRKTVTIKEDQPAEQEGAPAAPATLERKKSLFKKRQASSVVGGDEQQQQLAPPRRSGLRPRMPPALRVPSNINERSSSFIEQRRRSFVRGGKPAPDK